MTLFSAQSGFFDEIARQFTATFIEKNRYELFLTGFLNTLIIALFATVLGALIGTLASIARVSYDRAERPGILIRVFNRISVIYIAVFRGTPIIVQLSIMYYIVFRSMDNAFLTAILAFAINSGAYMAEIVRAGIMSVDIGQTEAGRSLGLSSGVTMRLIVLPQAVKNILPALGNEFIALLKETSVAGFITVLDLNRAGDRVRADTMNPFFSLFSIAVVYLILVLGFTAVLKRVERRLRQSDRR